MTYSWNWHILLEQPYLGWLVRGLELTLAISLSGWLIALTLGTAIGVTATLPMRPLRIAAATYINIFRNVPLLLQLFLWFFVVPEILPDAWGRWLKRELPLPELWTSIVALGFFTSARVAVQVRAGIHALPKGQGMAASASGMTIIQLYRFVLLPQAFRIIVPPMTSDFLTIFKNSALALTIGVFELTAQSRQIESFTFQSFEAFTAATMLYLLIALVVTAIMGFLERRGLVPGQAGALA